ncbi:MAG: AlpA family transcriptional regulator [Betaproteobacteria bacterium]|nr:AlpA family transcriptional regulator [Betaproteobacteria bacterium]
MAHLPRRLLRLPDVEQAVGYRRTAIYDKVKTGEFPKPIPLGPRARAVGWISEEIEAWIESRIQAAQQPEQQTLKAARAAALAAGRKAARQRRLAAGGAK